MSKIEPLLKKMFSLVAILLLAADSTKIVIICNYIVINYNYFIVLFFKRKVVIKYNYIVINCNFVNGI